MPVIARSDLPMSVIARQLVGRDHGVNVSLFLVDAPPGRGPSAHTHPYDELLLVEEGRGTFLVGEEEVEAGAGDIVIAPAGTPHAFTNTGDATLRLTTIHASDDFVTDWLEG